MTTPIEDQLRSYFGEIEEQALARGVRPRVDGAAAVVPVITLDPLTGPGSEGHSMSRNIWLGGAAAAVIALVVALVAFRGGSTTEVEPSDTPLTPEEVSALAVVGEWYDAYAVGDLDELQRLYPPRTGVAEERRGDTLELAAWDHAQGLTTEDRQCTVEEAESFIVTCELTAVYPIRELVGAPRVTLSERITVRGEAVLGVTQQFIEPGLLTLNEAFKDWVETQHPDDVRASVCCIWPSIEDARALGERRAELAVEWAAWLTENDCTYDEPCEPVE